MKFTEAQLEKAIIDLLGAEGYRHVHGGDIQRYKSEVLLKDDLKEFLPRRYEDEYITESEVDAIIRQLEMMSSADLYESNKAVLKMVCDGMYLKREDRSQKDLGLSGDGARNLDSVRGILNLPERVGPPSLLAQLWRDFRNSVRHLLPALPTNNHSESFAILFSIGTRILVWSDYCSGD